MDRESKVAPIAEPEQAPPTPIPETYNNLLLSAIVLTDEKKIALVQTDDDLKVHRLQIGESIEGWAVQEIQNKEIMLIRGNETKQLELKVIKSTATGNTTPPWLRSPPVVKRKTVPSNQGQQAQAEKAEQPASPGDSVNQP